MVDIQALRERLAQGEDPAQVAESIKNDAEIVAAGFWYECGKLAKRGDAGRLAWLLDRFESWRKEDMR